MPVRKIRSLKETLRAVAIAATISVSGFGVTAVGTGAAYGAPSATQIGTANVTKVIALATGETRIRVDLNNRLGGKTVTLRVLTQVNGSETRLNLGKIKLSKKKAKGVLKVSRKIAIGDRILVFDGSRRILNSRVSVIEDRSPVVAQPPAAGGGAPSQSSPSPSQPTLSPAAVFTVVESNFQDTESTTTLIRLPDFDFVDSVWFTDDGSTGWINIPLESAGTDTSKRDQLVNSLNGEYNPGYSFSMSGNLNLLIEGADPASVMLEAEFGGLFEGTGVTTSEVTRDGGEIAVVTTISVGREIDYSSYDYFSFYTGEVGGSPLLPLDIGDQQVKISELEDWNDLALTFEQFAAVSIDASRLSIHTVRIESVNDDFYVVIEASEQINLVAGWDVFAGSYLALTLEASFGVDRVLDGYDFFFNYDYEGGGLAWFDFGSDNSTDFPNGWSWGSNLGGGALRNPVVNVNIPDYIDPVTGQLQVLLLIRVVDTEGLDLEDEENFSITSSPRT
jgi:hypothetical protein